MQSPDLDHLPGIVDHIQNRLAANPALWDRIETHRQTTITSLRFAQLGEK